MRPIALTLSACLLVAACETMPQRAERPAGYVFQPADSAQPNPLARSVTFTCEDTSTVTFTEGESSVLVAFNSGTQMRLARIGDRYGELPYEFVSHGNEGRLRSSGRTFRCRIK